MRLHSDFFSLATSVFTALPSTGFLTLLTVVAATIVAVVRKPAVAMSTIFFFITFLFSSEWKQAFTPVSYELFLPFRQNGYAAFYFLIQGYLYLRVYRQKEIDPGTKFYKAHFGALFYLHAGFEVVDNALG